MPAADSDSEAAGSWLDVLTSHQIKLFFTWLVKFSCHPGKLGAMATGASSNDPIFWILHPIFDRLWAFIRMAPEHAGFDHTWVDGGNCNGYNFHDLQPFSDLFGEGNEKHLYTNQELYQLFDPQNPTLNYVYDNFDWSHCS